MDPLELILKRLRRRLTLFRWFEGISRALLWGAIAACLWLFVTRLFPSLGDSRPVAAFFLALAVIGGTIHTWLKRPSMLHAALEADEVLGLQERLTSSLELADAEGEMVEALHRDARDHVGRLDMARDFPFRAPVSMKWLLVPFVLYLIGFLFLPEFDLFGYEEEARKAEAAAQARRVSAERLRNAARPLRDPMLEKNETLQEVAEGMERIALGVEAGEITDKQAVARLTKLEDALAAERDKMGAELAMPKLGMDTSKLNMTKSLAQSMQNGDLNKSLEEAQKLMEKIEMGELSPEDMASLGEEMGELAKMMGVDSSALAEALAKMGAQIQMDNKQGQQQATQQMQMTMQDLASMLQQMKLTEQALGKCKSCKSGMCKGNKFALGLIEGQGMSRNRSNWGLGGPGRGRGNQIGELPDTENAFDPTLLPGEMTRGKVLASIMQRAAPDEEETESNIEIVSEAFVEVQQQAEEALTQEEIPPGAREIVRQYFGSLEPEQE
jgi:hypothetical protein